MADVDTAAIVKEVHGVHNDIAYYGAMIVKRLDAIIASGGVAPATGSTTAPVTTAPAPTVDKYFPADPGDALAPSPENSRVVRLGDKISGKPYVLDATGVVHALVPSSDKFPNGYTVNGNRTGGGGSEELYSLLLVRQGQVYAQRSSGQWQKFNPGMGSMYNSSLPDAYVTDASGATTSTVAPSSAKGPDKPKPMSPAPGTSGKTLTVGKGKTYSTISDAVRAAKAGDTIDVDAGRYPETPPVLSVPLYLRAVGGQAVVDCTGLTDTLAYHKGAFVPTADCILEGFRVTGVALDQDQAELTSAVRPDAGCGYLTLRNMELDGNQSGLGTGGELNVVIVVEGGHFHNNGLPDGHTGRGYTHNIYTGAQTDLTLKGLVSDAPNGGHAVKHRGYAFASTGGTFDAFEAAVFDLPQGTVAQAVIDGATITKPAGAWNHSVVDYASENTDSGNGGLLIKNSTINANCENPFFLVGGGSVITLDASNKLTGTKPTAQGGKVVGL